jgi:hypothetical protein
MQAFDFGSMIQASSVGNNLDTCYPKRKHYSGRSSLSFFQRDDRILSKRNRGLAQNGDILSTDPQTDGVLPADFGCAPKFLPAASDDGVRSSQPSGASDLTNLMPNNSTNFTHTYE